MKLRLQGLCAALLACGASACLSVAYQRELTFEPVRAADMDTLEPGRSTLSEALARLGAPLYVREGRGGETILAYGASASQGFGLSFSVPLLDQTSASFDYNDASEKLEGYLLFFDADLTLKFVRSGLLRSLANESRPRPAPAS